MRYDTQNHMVEPTGLSPWRRVWRPRVLVYGGILGLIVAAVAVSLAMRHPFKVDVIRDRGALARLGPDGQIQNVYRLQLMNASERPQRFDFRVEGLPGLRLSEGDSAQAQPQPLVDGSQSRWVALSLELPPQNAAAVTPGSHPVAVWIQARDARDGSSLGLIREKTTFIVPR